MKRSLTWALQAGTLHVQPELAVVNKYGFPVFFLNLLFNGSTRTLVGRTNRSDRIHMCFRHIQFL